MSSSLPRVLWLKAILEKRFGIVDDGPTNFFLGIAVFCDTKGRILELHQQKYICKILLQFNQVPFVQVRQRGGVCLHGLHFNLSSHFHENMSVINNSVVGHLQYLNTCTRLDLASVLFKLSTHLKNPGFLHWQAAVRVFQYLEATKLVNLCYVEELQLEGMYDSSWGGDVDDRRSFPEIMCGVSIAPGFGKTILEINFR